MWMLTLIMAAIGEVTDSDSTPPTISAIHSEMDASMTQALNPPSRFKSSPPTVIPCPKEMCKRINHTHQEAYNKTMLSNGWLSMANRYDSGSVLIPNPESTVPRRFLYWHTEQRSLWMLVESGLPTSYYATWTLNALKPTSNPFAPQRLHTLEQTINKWLEDCNQKRPIDIDQWQNELSWSGSDCSGWDLWLEYTPTEERALSLLAIKR